MSENTPRVNTAKEHFARQASLYAESDVHRAGESLKVIMEYGALGQYEVAIDIGTGAGFTAFSIASYSTHVLATDIAPGMLTQVRRLASERNITNVEVVIAEAENLPLPGASMDAVSCRHAAHHFYDLHQSVQEARRVLKPGGVLLLADTVAPESNYQESWMNDVEVRRDATHQRNLKPSEWRTVLDDEGFYLTHSSFVKVNLKFDEWIRLSATPEEEAESLYRTFESASPAVVSAFDIRTVCETIHFHWDVLVVRAVRM
ncbi:class I SAM-dependent methyltransferase [Dehalococcoidia bacterium]|nr:class I SAM-dependent methyltransferase [Dehalococcoidia bacterium]